MTIGGLFGGNSSPLRGILGGAPQAPQGDTPDTASPAQPSGAVTSPSTATSSNTLTYTGAGGAGVSGPYQIPLWQLQHYQNVMAQRQGGGGSYTSISSTTFIPVQPLIQKPLPPTVLTLGEITAWRIWRVHQKRFLRSAAVSTVWEPGKPVTGDVTTAGVHCWKSLTDAVEYSDACCDGIQALGQVLIWGEVIEHEKGYRAEFASVKVIE